MHETILSYSLAFIILALSAASQNIIQHAPPGFDTLRTDIPHGKIDTISYFSKTVGNTAKIPDLYFRRVIQKRKNIRCSTCCMVLAAMKKNG